MQTETNIELASFPPISFSPAQVAGIVKFATWQSFELLSQQTGESVRILRSMANGRQPPSDAVLEALKMERAGDVFLFRFQ